MAERSRWGERHQSGGAGRFTNTAVRRFDGGGCWQQPLPIFQAIMKSNGWTDKTTALQLFAYLEREALNIALLMPEGERANWECLSRGLSDYYNCEENVQCEENQPDILNHNIQLNEVESVLADLSNNKSPGLDGITYEFIKHAPNRIISAICSQ